MGLVPAKPLTLADTRLVWREAEHPYVVHRHPGHCPTALKLVDDRRLVSLNGASDAGVQIVTLLEIDVYDVVAPVDAVQRNRRAVDVDPCQIGDITWLRGNLLDGLPEVPQFIGGSEGIVGVRRHSVS